MRGKLKAKVVVDLDEGEEEVVAKRDTAAAVGAGWGPIPL